MSKNQKELEKKVKEINRKLDQFDPTTDIQKEEFKDEYRKYLDGLNEPIEFPQCGLYLFSYVFENTDHERFEDDFNEWLLYQDRHIFDNYLNLLNELEILEDALNC